MNEQPNLSVLREYPYRGKPETKLQLTKEVIVPPEHPGRPFSDEMVGNLWLGPELAEINRQLKAENITEEDKINLSNKKARLYTAADAAGQWVYGPVNERKTTTVKAKLKFEKVKPHNDPGYLGDNRNHLEDYDEDRMPNQIVEPTQEPEKKKNWFQRKWQGIKEFDAYAKRNRKEADILALVGSGAGIMSALIGAGAAELALSLALPGIVAGPIGIASGLAINYFGFSRLMNKWSEGKLQNELKDIDQSKLDAAKIKENALLDHRHRIAAFSVADVALKIVTGLGLGSLLASGPQHDGANIGGNGTQPDQLGTSAHANAPVGAEPMPGVESFHPNFVEHVVSSNDEMLTKILEQNLPAGEHIYSENYIELLQDNRDTFVNMLKQMYPNGGVPYVVDANNTIKLPLDQAIANIDKVIARGYPDENTMSPELYRQALTDMFNAIRHLKVGTVIKIRQ